MKTFKIGVWEEQSGYMNIEAKTKKEANAKAEHIINYDGITEENTDITHRAFELV